MFLQQASQPIMARIVEQPAPGSTIGEVILGAIGLSGVMWLAAILVGLLVGGFFIALKVLRPGNSFNGEASDQISLRLNSLSR